MLTLKWKQMPGGGWYPLEGYNFSEIELVGVYFIWCDGNPSVAVRAGQGRIGARISVHKSDPDIMRHRSRGTMRVTWAEVPAEHLDRVERYLADYYRPIEGDRYPDVVPLVVNLPGQ
jgi:hypothetical protein